MIKVKEEKNQEIQQKYMILQMMKQQFNSLIEQKNVLDQRVNEITMTSNAIEEISKKKENQSWSPLGSGVFAFSELKNTDKFLIEIGAGVLLKKDSESAKRILSERITELQTVDTQLIQELTNINSQMQNLEKHLQSLIE